jgi:hypothetical protein
MTKELAELEAWAREQFQHCRHNFEVLEDKQARTASRVAGFAFLYMLKAIHGDYTPFRHHLMGDYDEDWEKSTHAYEPFAGVPRETLKEPNE